MTTALVALLTAVVAWSVGVPLTHSVLLGGASVVVGALVVAVPGPAALPPLPFLARRGGTRPELSRLAWSWGLGTRGVSHAVLDRLGTVAVRRLADLGIDVADPAQADAARRALGPASYDALVARAVPRRLHPRRFARYVADVERLGELRGPA